MSAPRELERLENVITRYGFAYLMTTSDKGSPHAVQTRVVQQGSDLVVNGVGAHTRANALARPVVGLIWPPRSEAEYSLIVDVEATVMGESLRIMPTRAVLHRAGPSASHEAGKCASDCVELSLTSR